jgi:hypothetical protein
MTPELVALRVQLEAEGLSHRAIARRVRRPRSTLTAVPALRRLQIRLQITPPLPPE